MWGQFSFYTSLTNDLKWYEGNNSITIAPQKIKYFKINTTKNARFVHQKFKALLREHEENLNK